jgi:hypothetical protein
MIARKPEYDATAASKDENHGRRTRFGREHGEFFKAWLWCPMVGKDPRRFPTEGVHHRRTVGLDIPCQVALLQSLTPLLQATVL